MFILILSGNVLFGLAMLVPFSIMCGFWSPKMFSRSATVSVLLGKGFCIVNWAIAGRLMSLLPMYDKRAVSDSKDSVIDTAIFNAFFTQVVSDPTI